MRTLLVKGLSIIITVSFFLFLIPVCTYAISYTDKTSAPPIVAVRDYSTSYGCRVGDDINLYAASGVYYLFLPLTANIGALKVKYTGSGQLYDPDTGSKYVNGSTAFLKCSGTTGYVYEYVSGTYYRYTFTIMRSSQLDTLYFTLDGGVNDIIRMNTSKDNTCTGTLRILDENGGSVYDGALTKMNARGNTSYEASGVANTKNGYNFNIESKISLIDGAGKDKKYSLLKLRTAGEPRDKSGLSNDVGFYLFNSLIDDPYYGIHARYADVYIGGEYRGLYLLTERMDINGAIEVTDQEDESSDKTNVTGGYVMEVGGDQNVFSSSRGMNIGVKSPEVCTSAEKSYISKYIQNFEDALFSPTGYNSKGVYYMDYISANTLAAQVLVQAFCLNWETYRTSTYLYKDVDGSACGKLCFGPVWDLEASGTYMGSINTMFDHIYTYTTGVQPLWLQQLWTKGDFMTLMYTMEQQLDQSASQLLGLSASTGRIFNLNDLSLSISSSQAMNWKRWAIASSYETQRTTYISGTTTRYYAWKNLWRNNSYLMGLTLGGTKNTDGSITFTAYASGTVTGSYSWYRIDGSNLSTSGTLITKTDSPTYTTTTPGSYYCIASGGNNAYWSGAANSCGTVFRTATVSMTTNILNYESVKNATPTPAPTKKPTTTPAFGTPNPGTITPGKTAGGNGATDSSGNPTNSVVGTMMYITLADPDGTVTLRKAPSDSSDAISQLSNGAAVTILSITGSWYYVVNAVGEFGYIPADTVAVAGGSPSLTDQSVASLTPTGTLETNADGTTKAPVKNNSDQDLRTALWIICGGILVTSAAVTAVILFNRKTKSETEQQKSGK